MDEFKTDRKKYRTFSIVIGFILVLIAIVLLLYKPVFRNLINANRADSDYLTQIVMDNLVKPNDYLVDKYTEYQEDGKNYGEIHNDAEIVYNYKLNPLLQLFSGILALGGEENSLPFTKVQPGTYQYAQRGDNWTLTYEDGTVVKEYENEGEFSFSELCTELDVKPQTFRKALETVEKIYVSRITEYCEEKHENALYGVSDVYSNTTKFSLNYNQEDLIKLEKALLSDFKKVKKTERILGEAYLGGDFEDYLKDFESSINDGTSFGHQFTLVKAHLFVNDKGEIIGVDIDAELDKNYVGEMPENLEEVNKLTISLGHTENNGKVGYELLVFEDDEKKIEFSGNGTYDEKLQVLNGSAIVKGVSSDDISPSLNLEMENMQFISNSGHSKLGGKLTITVVDLENLKISMFFSATNKVQKIDFGIDYGSMDFMTGDITITDK